MDSSILDQVGQLVRGHPTIRVVECRSLDSVDGVYAGLEVGWVDHREAPRSAYAHLWMPRDCLSGAEPKPLCYAAGYEINDDQAGPLLAQGYVVVNPGGPADTPDLVYWNPLTRGLNLDFMLMHFARGLPFVDISRVSIAGGSAGGYMALMVAAETFPAAMVLADVPPVNLGYEIAYVIHNTAVSRERWREVEPALPGLFQVSPLGPAMVELYERPADDEIWLRHSPVAVVDLVTAPVSIILTTADTLVPLDQHSPEHVQRPVLGSMPDGFTTNPAAFTSAPSAMVTLAEVLRGRSARFDVVEVPATAAPMTVDPEHPEVLPEFTAVQIPWPDVQWAVAILDEGAPDADTVHVKYALGLQRDEAVRERLLTDPGVDQLTPAKLSQLLKRLAGVEWLSPGMRHLDMPDAERADVLRGLRAYLRNPAARERFREVYGQKDATEKSRAGLPVTSDDALRELQEPAPVSRGWAAPRN